jgi:endonuclease YncB( thermonuclease family)
MMAWQRLYLDQRGWFFLILTGAVIAFAWGAGQDLGGKDGRACIIHAIETGDTVQATRAGKAVTIRLYCIDAPDLEKRPSGPESRDYLRRIAPPTVSLRAHGQDQDGRMMGELLGTAGKSLNLAMVEAGHATVNAKTCHERRFFVAQRRAKAERRGIWDER